MKKILNYKKLSFYIVYKSDRKPGRIETHDGIEFENEVFTGFLNGEDINIFSRKTSKGVVFAGRFSRTIGDLLKEPVF